MRKFITTVVLSAFVLSQTAVSAVGDVCGYIYSTDILAYVNSLPVPSYNIGGKTAIILEDLNADGNRNYGIDCEYSDAERLLTAKLEYAGGGYGPEISRGKTGEIVGEIYETDIQVHLNGFLVKGYNIGGKTAVCIEDIGNASDGSENNEYGYSKFLSKYRWDAENREIYLNPVNDTGNHFIREAVDRTVFTMADNKITAARSPWNRYYSDFDYEGQTFKDTEDFWQEERVLKPLYLKTADISEEQIGLCYKRGEVTYLCDVDYEKVKSIVEETEMPPISYDDVFAAYDDGVKYKTLDKCETDDYTFIVAEILGSAGEMDSHNWIYYVSARKNGGFAVVGISSGHYTKRELEITEKNTVEVTVSPFAGTPGSGVNSMSQTYVLDSILY